MDTFEVIPYKAGFIIVKGNSPIRTPNKNGTLVWRTYKTKGEAEEAARKVKESRA